MYNCLNRVISCQNRNGYILNLWYQIPFTNKSKHIITLKYHRDSWFLQKCWLCHPTNNTKALNLHMIHNLCVIASIEINSVSFRLLHIYLQYKCHKNYDIYVDLPVSAILQWSLSRYASRKPFSHGISTPWPWPWVSGWVLFVHIRIRKFLINRVE